MITEGLALSTKVRYDGLIDKFLSFHSEFARVLSADRSVEDVDEDFLLLFLAWKWKFSTWSQTRKLIAAIKHYYKNFYGFDPFIENKFRQPINMYKVQRAIREIKRADSDFRKIPKFALTKFDLLKTKPFFNFSRYDHTCAWAIVCLAVDCLLRWSEVCFTSVSNIDKILLVRDWTKVTSNSHSLRLHDTKTKLFGDGMLVTTTKNTTGVCAITAMDEYLARFRKTAKLGEPLFRTGAKSISKAKPSHAMSSSTIQTILKVVLKKAGFKDALWESGISPRRGGATTLAACGVPDRIIRAYRRWRSWSYRVYIDLQPAERESWAACVNRQVGSSEEKQAEVAPERMEWIIYNDL